MSSHEEVFLIVPNRQQKTAICNAPEAQVMQGGAKQHSFISTNLNVNLKKCFPEALGVCENQEQNCASTSENLSASLTSVI